MMMTRKIVLPAGLLGTTPSPLAPKHLEHHEVVKMILMDLDDGDADVDVVDGNDGNLVVLPLVEGGVEVSGVWEDLVEGGL